MANTSEPVCKPIDPDAIEALRGTTDFIVYDLDAENPYPELLLLVKFRMVCTGRDTPGIVDCLDLLSADHIWKNPASMEEIPVTVTGNPPYFVVEVIGHLDGVALNIQLLFRVNNQWYEVQKSKIPVKGAERVWHEGNYADGTGGIFNVDDRIGLRPFLQAISNLMSRPNDIFSFITILFHIPEPARFHLIAEHNTPLMVDLETVVNLHDSYKTLLLTWSGVSEHIEKYPKTNKWPYSHHKKTEDERDIFYRVADITNIGSVVAIRMRQS